MNRIVLPMLTVGLSLAVVASGYASEVNPREAKIVAEVEKLGGKVTVDERGPGEVSDRRGTLGHPRDRRRAGTP